MIIIIPAYDPDDRLISLIHNIKENCGYDIVIVNDGSSPSCSKIFRKANHLGCTVLDHENNRGKGAALKTAFSYLISNHPEENIVCADCDGQHTWQDILKIAHTITAHPRSIILGCREFVGRVPARSLLGNKITSFVYSKIAKSKISDTQTGLRGFSSHMLPWLVTIQGTHYEYEMNQLLESREAGYDLFCVPIETIYENNNVTSHFHPIKDSFRIYLPIMKFVLSSISCGIIDFVALFLFNGLTRNLLLSVVAARIISSLCNYFINRTIVFHTQSQSHRSSIVKYYALVLFILVCNYSLINLFVNMVGLPLVVGKLATECILYLLSYIIQHRIVFK